MSVLSEMKLTEAGRGSLGRGQGGGRVNPTSCAAFVADVLADVSDSVYGLLDKLQEALLEYIKSRHGGNTKRLGHLFLLLPPITQIKGLLKNFWSDIKKDGRVIMHKLFLEMLEADS